MTGGQFFLIVGPVSLYILSFTVFSFTYENEKMKKSYLFTAIQIAFFVSLIGIAVTYILKNNFLLGLSGIIGYVAFLANGLIFITPKIKRNELSTINIDVSVLLIIGLLFPIMFTMLKSGSDFSSLYTFTDPSEISDKILLLLLTLTALFWSYAINFYYLVLFILSLSLKKRFNSLRFIHHIYILLVSISIALVSVSNSTIDQSNLELVDSFNRVFNTYSLLISAMVIPSFYTLISRLSLPNKKQQ